MRRRSWVNQIHTSLVFSPITAAARTTAHNSGAPPGQVKRSRTKALAKAKRKAK